MNRRTLFKSIGGALILMTGAGTAFVATRDATAARAPWQVAGQETDPILFALRHGVLAPNPHNRQPWIIALDGASADISCDLDKRLPETDPLDRQITIGFGCFLEVVRIAAAEKGLRVDMVPFPDGEPEGRLDSRPVARLTFTPDARFVRDPLFRAIAIRRSVKEPFDMTQPITDADLKTLGQEGMTGSHEAALVKDVRKLTWDAWNVEAQIDRTWMESVNLMRIGKSEIIANPDGIDLGGALFDTLQLAGQLSREQIADRTTQAYKGGEDSYHEIMATSMGFLWLVTPGNSRVDQLDAGRRYVRTHLRAAQHNIAFHPISQSLQEFVEMTPLYDKIHARLGVNAPGRIQMLARIGHFKGAISESPRWPLEAKLRRV
jgi:hypothetical protein